MPLKVNKIMGFYTDSGELTDQDQDYSYAQIELMGKHAKVGSQKYMLVSKQDLNSVLNFQWYLGSNGYPGTHGSIDGDIKCGSMYPIHRFLFPNTPKGYVIDHINRDRLDNRRSNLRVITAKQNSYNRSRPSNSKSKFKGVRKDGNKFKAVISKDNKVYEIRNCETERDAALAYDAMAGELFGEYAGLNLG